MVSPAVLGVKIIHACLHSAYRTVQSYLFPADLAFPPLWSAQPESLCWLRNWLLVSFGVCQTTGGNEVVWRVQRSLFDEVQETIFFFFS